VATYVLIPGAGGDGWQWHLLVRDLESRGQEAIAVDLPSGDERAGWSEYADAVIASIGAPRERALILVAQSLAGFTAPLVCDRIPVDLLVLLNAMIPRPGETGNDWWGDTGSGEAMRQFHDSIGLSAADADDPRILYYHDVPPAIVEEAWARGEPQQTMTPMGQPFGLEAWPDVPTRVIAGRDDRLFPLEFQRRVAKERLGLDVDAIDGGHMVALSHPAALADRLEAYRTELRIA
jgi:pimeloyl-ACP methyl ester carboxylesterase